MILYRDLACSVQSTKKIHLKMRQQCLLQEIMTQLLISFLPKDTCQLYHNIERGIHLLMLKRLDN